MNLQDSQRLTTQWGNIAYYQQNANLDQTLILLHGNSASSRCWQPYFDSSLARQFNLLAFDLPGHGNSQKAVNPEATYHFPAYGALLLEVVERLVQQPYYIVGHSLGGHIALEALPQMKNCKGVLIQGAPPFGIPLQIEKAFHVNPQLMTLFADAPDPVALKEIFRGAFYRGDDRLITATMDDYLQTDPVARQHLLLSIQQGQYADEMVNIQQSSVPVYLVHAENDVLVNGAYFQNMPHNLPTIWMPEAGHYLPVEEPDRFMMLVTDKFLTTSSQPSTPVA